MAFLNQKNWHLKFNGGLPDHLDPETPLKL